MNRISQHLAAARAILVAAIGMTKEGLCGPQKTQKFGRRSGWFWSPIEFRSGNMETIWNIDILDILWNILETLGNMSPI